MRKVKVDLEDRGYSIHIAPGAIDQLGRILKRIGPAGPMVVITDRTVWGKLGRKVRSAFEGVDAKVLFVFVPSGEQAKSIDVFRKVISDISVRTKGHAPVIVALGGGVVGDLAGFVAATYRRGVNLVQVPTTLLAQVDSSIGGKVAIDIPEAKNMVGAFYQPDAVLSDISFLLTLPPLQLRNGLAEVIKYGIISGMGFFEFLERDIGKLLALDQEALTSTVYRCARIKADIVASDERDRKDIRIFLNFGHTLGHAVEAASGYKGYAHGEAVSIGMMMAARLAVELGMFEVRQLERLGALLDRASLPVLAKGLPAERIIESFRYDKKFLSGRNRFILPRDIGELSIVENIPVGLIRKVVQENVAS